MNLCIDIGNTRIKIALFKDQELIEHVVFEKNQEDAILHFLDATKFSKSILCSVSVIPEYLVNHLQVQSHFILLSTSPKVNCTLPIELNYNSISSLGVDRLAAASGAAILFPNQYNLVINAGTCITYDLLDSRAVFQGGNIAPGLRMRWRAMHEFTDRLPLVDDKDISEDLLGKNTRSALQLGVIHGIRFEMESYYYQLHAKYQQLNCVISGGDAEFLADKLKIKNFVEPLLVLKGLNFILLQQ
ncbi:MAG: type III pantothenate kinase [Bacteroidota bacterium]|nr:type III pantothenate kinase [Bacteroidota bacterium]